MEPLPTTIEDLESQAFSQLDMADVTSEEYTRGIANLKTIQSLKPKRLLERIDPNVVISGMCSLGGILTVLHYEKAAVIASKAFGLITKIRI